MFKPKQYPNAYAFSYNEVDERFSVDILTGGGFLNDLSHSFKSFVSVAFKAMNETNAATKRNDTVLKILPASYPLFLILKH